MNLNTAVRIGLRLGGAQVEWPKYFFLPITMKLTSTVQIATLIIYHQGTEKNFTGRSLFAAKPVFLLSASYLYAIYPKNEAHSLVNKYHQKQGYWRYWYG
jgi:hypothetical protein